MILQQTAKLIAIFLICCFLSGCLLQRKQYEVVVEIPKDVLITEALAKIEANKNNPEVKTSSIEIPLAAISLAADYLKTQKYKKDKVIYKIIVYDNSGKEAKIELLLPNVELKSNVENYKKEKEDVR